MIFFLIYNGWEQILTFLFVTQNNQGLSIFYMFLNLQLVCFQGAKICKWKRKVQFNAINEYSKICIQCFCFLMKGF